MEREGQFGFFSQPERHRVTIRTNRPDLVQLGEVRRGVCGDPLIKEIEVIVQREVAIFVQQMVPGDFALLVRMEFDLGLGQFLPFSAAVIVGTDQPDDTKGVVEIPLWV